MGPHARLLIATLGLAAGASAAIDPGAAGTFGVLAGTLTGIGASSTIIGDAGYGALVGVPPIVTGTVYTSGGEAAAGAAQAALLSQLNAQACTFNFPTGAVDLAGGSPVYPPGVYCGDAAMNLAGGGTITLNGYGVYIFRATGALNTSANSHVVLTGGAVPSDVFWTPLGATMLGANSEFVGTIIDLAGITLGSTVSWTGRALSAGGAVLLDSDTIIDFIPRLSVNILSATWYDFAAVAPGSTHVSATTFDLLNDGNVPELIALSLTDPAPWVSTVSGVPAGMNQYELDAQFNVPGSPGSWIAARHALTAAPAPSTPTRFAGNEDAAFVSPGGERHLWVRFLAPVLTDQVGSRAMRLTITAQAP